MGRRRVVAVVTQWAAQRRGRGRLPPIVDRLEFFGDLASPRTSIVSGAVAVLGDESGYGRDLTQSTPAARPTYNASDPKFNGQPSMTLNGTSHFMSYAAGLPAMSKVTFFLTLRSLTTAGFTRLVTIDDGLNVVDGMCGVHIAGVFGASHTIVGRFEHPVSTASTQSMLVPTTPASRIACSGDVGAGGSLWSTYVNGASSVSSTTSAATAGGATSTAGPLVLGASKAGTLFAGFTVTKVLIYSRLFTATEIALMDDWAAWRDGLNPIMTGLELWGDLSSPSTSILSGAVATLGDSSGKERHLTQAAPGKRPTYNASDPNFGNRPSMSFDGISQVLGTAVGALPAMGAVTAYFSTRNLSSAGYLACVAPGGVTGALFFYYYTYLAYNQFMAVFENPMNTSSAMSNSRIKTSGIHVTAFAGALSVGGAAWDCMVDDTPNDNATVTVNATAGGATSTAYATFIGARTNTDNFIGGDFGDVLLYSGIHSRSQIVRMREWLNRP